ncbi:MAG: sulfurtransferase TusA family protein [Pseudomonadota bacterium]
MPDYPDADLTIDALGLLCPLPVLRTRKRMEGLASGEVVHLMADDPAAVIDVPHFCTEAGHGLLHTGESDAGMLFVIRKGG